MSPTHEEALRALEQNAEGFAEQISSLSLSVLAPKYDRGVKRPRTVTQAPGELSTSLIDYAAQDRDLAEQFETMVYEKAQELIRTALRCTEVAVYAENSSATLRRGRPYNIIVEAWF